VSIEDYEPVASRLARFWEKHPEGRVITKLITFEGDRVIVQADIYVDREDDRPIATDFAEEIRGSNNVNKTSHVENACTSAIGRALADCDFASSTDWTKRPSREEMQKVERMSGDTRITEPSNLASEKQQNMIRAVCKSMGKVPPANLQGMTKREASAYIDTLKSAPAPQDEEPEEAF
jgi:bisphosphoglycerate-dependent phosphoglycerate mutase